MSREERIGRNVYLAAVRTALNDLALAVNEAELDDLQIGTSDEGYELSQLITFIGDCIPRDYRVNKVK